MTTYNELAGYRVNYLSTDPTLNSGNEGQVWYNSTSGTLKSLVQLKAWSAGGNMATARRGSANMGTQTAGAVAGGQAAPAYTNATEEYSGYTWAAGGNLNTTRAFLAGAGTQTTGLAFGGEAPPDSAATEEYNGSSWTSNPTGLNTARRNIAGCGLQTAGLGFGGIAGTTNQSATESYNGSTWTSVNSLNTARTTAGAGTQTAALAIGGPSAVVESWNGTSWTNGPSLVTQIDGNAAAGIQTNAITFGGYVPPGVTLTAITQQYDGSAWATVPSLATARRELMGMGTAQAALAAGGFTPPTFSAATEEFNSSINAITNAVWASGGNVSTARTYLASAATQNDIGLIFGGQTVPLGAGIPQSTATEEYDGSAWTNGGSLPVSISRMAGFGTQTAALGAGGYSFPTPISTPGSSYVRNAYTYDGSTWTAGTQLGTSRDGAQGAGIQTAGIVFGGLAGPNASPGPYATQASAATESWNGSSWTTVNSMNQIRTGFAGTGTQTSAMASGGGSFPQSLSYIATTEKWNGTSWSTTDNMPRGLQYHNMFGTAALAIFAGGVFGPNPSSPGTSGMNNQSYEYNGTSFSSVAQNASNHFGAGGSGSGSSGLIASGASAYATMNSATEEYVGGTSVTTASTLTTS